MPVASVGLGVFGRRRSAQRVVAGADADEDAGLGVLERGRDDAGVLEGLPGRFEEQAVLGVEAPGLAGADAEEGGVEEVDLVEHGGLPDVALGLASSGSGS